MCNASEDVYSLKRNKQVTESQGEVRVDTVASSASITAKVAAVIQRGGSFLSGSDMLGQKIVQADLQYASLDPYPIRH